MDYQSLSHTKWECKYRVVFMPFGVFTEVQKEKTV